MAPKLTLAEVYSDLRCAGGTALCAMEDARLVRTRALSGAGTNELLADLPRSSLAWAQLRERRVVSLTFSDGSFEEWRITELEEDARQDGGILSSITAHWPEVDLATAGVLSRVEADGTTRYSFEAFGLTLTQHVALITSWLTGQGVTYFAAGTLEAVGPIDLVYDRMTPLAACLALAEQVGGTTGRKVEFQVRRNGTTNYLLDFLTQIGAGAPRLYVQFGKNELGIRRRRSSADQATQLVGLGTVGPNGPATLGEALWEVASAPSGTTARLIDTAGGDGPILEDDQLNGLYARKWPSGSWIQVNDSALLNHEVTMAGAHSWVAGDRIQFGTSAVGAELRTLKSPAGIALYGTVERPLDRPDLPGHVNVLPNPAMRLYTGASNAAPDGWAVIPGCGLAVANVDKETTASRYRVGGASAKVVTTADGHGIETGYGTIAPSDRKPFASGFVGFWNDTDGAQVRVDLVAGKGTVAISSMSRTTAGGITTVTVNTGAAHGLTAGSRAELLGVTGGTVAEGYLGIQVVTKVVDSDTYEFQLTSDPGTLSLSSATSRQVWLFPDGVNKVALTQNAKVWEDLGWQNEDLKALGATVAKVRVMQHGATGLTMYVDRAQVTLGAGEGQLPFVEGSGATQLWQAVNRSLAERKDPAVRYDVGLLDLGRLDPVRWPYDDLTLGGPIDVDDQRWALDVSTRILQIKQVLRAADGDLAVAELVLSNRPGDLTDELVRPARANRTTGGSGLEEVPRPEAYFYVPPNAPTQVQIRLSSTPIGARLYYWIGDAGQAPPKLGTTTSGAPTTTAWGTYSTPFTMNRVQSADLALWVYAVAGGRVSSARPFTIDRDTSPSATLSLAQVLAAGVASNMKASWAIDIDVVAVQLFVRRTASPGSATYPTVGGGTGDPLDSTYYVGSFPITSDQRGVSGAAYTGGAGQPLTGALEYTHHSTYASNDWFAVIAVPVDRLGNLGARATAQLQCVGSTPATIASLTASRTSDGTACGAGTGAQFSVSWTKSGTWSDATHDLNLYFRVDGGAWQLFTTVTNPNTVSSATYTSELQLTSGKFDPTHTFEFKGELVDTVPTVLSTRQSNVLSLVSSCPVTPP